MSSRNSRVGILDAALALIVSGGDATVSMSDIAKAAHVSRQAIYLHFADRAALMSALVRHVDEKRDLESELKKVRTASNAVEAIRLSVSLQARTNPDIWAIARAYEAIRRTDPDAEAGWQDRLQHRLEFCGQIIARVEGEGRLKRGLAAAVATDLLWSITSLRMWEDLVLQRGWTAEDYQTHIESLLLEALVEPESVD